MPVDSPDKVRADSPPVDEIADGRRARGDRTRRRSSTRPSRSPRRRGSKGLSIGRLAEELGVSKSGLFAHFGSKIDLQLATVDAAREIFIDEVIGGSRAGLGHRRRALA